MTKENIDKLLKPSPYIYIPFWAFILRILSSTNCLIFGNDKNYLEKDLTKIIREEILLSMYNKNNINLSWINLITDDIKNEKIFNKKINMFYIFFNKICSVKINAEKDILNYIHNLLLTFYQSLFQILLSNKFDELLNTDINSNKFHVINFIKNPKEYIKNFININLSKQMLILFEKQNCINYSKSLEDFISLLNITQEEIKQKVNDLEEKVNNYNKNNIIERFESKHHREISEEEKESLFQEFEYEKIFFGQYTIDDIILLFRNTVELLKTTFNHIQNLLNNKDIDIQEFNQNYIILDKHLKQFDILYNFNKSDENFEKYLYDFQKKMNSFINVFEKFSEKYKDIPKVNKDKIYMKDFSLPVFPNVKYEFSLNDINDKPSLLSQAFIIKKNGQLLCNYKKLYFNPGPLSPELFEQFCNLKIYSLVQESLNVEIETKYKKENDEEKKEEFINLYDTQDKKYMKLRKSHVDPNSSIIIEFSFPPPNTTNEEKIYKLNRTLKVSDKTSSIDIIIEVIFVIHPIQIVLICEKYSLTFDNEKYRLNAKKLLNGETLEFKFENNNNEIPFELQHRIKSFNDNTFDEPLIKNENSNKFIITLKRKNDKKDMYKIDILHCLIEFFVSEHIKIPILINSLIIPTYFDFYIYDFSTKSFLADKMNIFIPSFEKECEIKLYFLVSTFIDTNIIGTFTTIKKSEGVSIVESTKEINMNSFEKYFSIKIKINLTKFDDDKIATFEFKINSFSKKIELFQNNQNIKEIDIEMIKEIKDEKKINVNNLDDIEKNAILISPFTCWGKGEFLYRQIFINDKKDLILELPENVNLLYLSNEGTLEKEKEDNKLIIIQKEDKWFSVIGFEDYISINTFQKILHKNLDNFNEDFNKYFPIESQNIQLNRNPFESLLSLFLSKTKDLIEDKSKVLNLIENFNINDYIDNQYYNYNEVLDFNHSKTVQDLIIKINEDNIKIKDDYKDKDLSQENDINEEEESGNDNDNQISTNTLKTKFLIQNGVPMKESFDKSLIKKNSYDFGENEMNNIEIAEINTIEIPKVLTINSLIKYFEDCEVGTIILPLYIYKAKKSQNIEEEKIISKYFSQLANAFTAINNKDDNLISEYTNNYKNSFLKMMQKLFEVGFKKNYFNFDFAVNVSRNQELIFMLPPKLKFKIPKSDFSQRNNKNLNLNSINSLKEIEEKGEIEEDEKKEETEEEVMSTSRSSSRNTKKKNSNIFNDLFESLFKHFSLGTPKKEIKPIIPIIPIPLPILPLKLPEEIQKVYLSYETEKKFPNKAKNKNEGILKKEIQSRAFIVGNDFEENKFDIKNEIKIIIEHMKKSNKTKFQYKTTDSLINLEDIKEYKDDKNEGNLEYLQRIIDISKPITKKLIKEISTQNLQKEIQFNELEMNVIFDCTRILTKFQKFVYFIIIISLINAFHYLEIKYLFAIVGDCKFKVVLKSFDEPHSKEIIRRIFDSISIERYRTNIASCAKVAIDKFPRINRNSQRIFYFLTNGLDDEYKLYEEGLMKYLSKIIVFLTFYFIFLLNIWKKIKLIL